MKIPVVQLTFCAVCMALATVLSLITPYTMPQGGSVTLFSMIFVVLPAYYFGAPVGIVVGTAYGLLQLAFGAYVVHPAQLILDYPLAFAMLGLAGLFRKFKYGLPIGYAVGVLGRYACHVVSGVVFFASYANGGNVLWYSLTYNSFVLVEMVVTLVILFIPQIRAAFERLKPSFH